MVSDGDETSIHNAGLIYLETGAFEKAEMAFKQAIELEGDVPARFMALAKTEEKLGNTKKAIEALENAYELDPSVSVLRQILSIYEMDGDAESAAVTTARIEEQIASDNAAKRKKTKKTVEKSARPVQQKRVVKKRSATVRVRTK